MPEMSKTYYEEWAEDLDDAPLPAILMVIGYMLVLILDWVFFGGHAHHDMAEDEHKPTKRVNLARDILNDDYSHSSVPDERPVIIDEEGIKGKETNDELATKTNQNIF